MEDNQSDSEVPVEAEVRDIRSCIQAMESKFKDMEDCFTSLKRELQCISELAQQQEDMRMEAEDETETAAADAAVGQLTAEKLSQTAKTLLGRWPPKFEEFLLDKSFGKPKPYVLPIARGYTPTGTAEEIHELVNSLLEFHSSLRQAHIQYKEERRKDVNLERRIKLLVENLQKELGQEGREGRHQTSMDSYVTRN